MPALSRIVTFSYSALPDMNRCDKPEERQFQKSTYIFFFARSAALSALGAWRLFVGGEDRHVRRASDPFDHRIVPTVHAFNRVGQEH